MSMRQLSKPIWDEGDAQQLRGALGALEKLLMAMPPWREMSLGGRSACEKACDARNRLRELMARHAEKGLTLGHLGESAKSAKYAVEGRAV